METHNPKQTIELLQVILSNSAKKIAFLFGAGISTKDKNGNKLIPAIDEMTATVISTITDPTEAHAISLIQAEIASKHNLFNVETLLSKISEKERAVDNEKLCGLNRTQLTELRNKIELEIIKLTSVHKNADFKTQNQYHFDFVQWIKNADRESCIEIFTINYDLLLENALELHQVPYFDGFIGSHNAFFYPEWVEHNYAVKDWTKLWKIHGSLGWKHKENDIVRSFEDHTPAIIYPSLLKYDHSKKQPYLSYIDRLSSFLRQDDSVLFICGYSFGDDHINETIITALSYAKSSHVFVLKNGDMKEEDNIVKIAKRNSKISIFAKRSAVIGSSFAEWKLDKEPEKNESYNILDYGFDEDAVPEDQPWNGKGNFLLGDFSKFTNFLSLFYAESRFLVKK